MNQRSDDRARGCVAALLIALVLYVASCGPGLATGFWLRDRTGIDAFYAVILVYYPLLRWGGSPVDRYVTWWCNAFNTSGPG